MRLGGGVVDVVALAHGEPCFDFGVFVSGVVVGDDVDVGLHYRGFIQPRYSPTLHAARM